jgi:hypothetical protein
MSTRAQLAAQAAEIAEAYGYATRFLQAFCENNSLRQVDPLPTLCGVLTQIDSATTVINAKDARIAELEAALEFYADPDTYCAIGFFPDHPCGEFVEDFDESHGNENYRRPMPGARARAALAGSPAP